MLDGVIVRFVVAVAVKCFVYVQLALATAIVTHPTAIVAVPTVHADISIVIVYRIPA